MKATLVIPVCLDAGNPILAGCQMPIYCREGLNAGVTVVVFSDPFSPLDSEAVILDICARHHSAAPLQLLFDARYTATPMYAFGRNVAQFVEQHFQQHPYARIALVISTRHNGDIAQLPATVETFRDWSAAERWLRNSH